MTTDAVETVDPLAELHARIDTQEKRLDDFEQRLASVMTEVRGHMERISEEGREGRTSLHLSNRNTGEMVQGFRTTLDIMVAENQRVLNTLQNALSGFNRNAEGIARRMRTMETVIDELRLAKREHKTATQELQRERRRQRRRHVARVLAFWALSSMLPTVAAWAQWAENRPPAGTAHSLPKRLFPEDNWWNLSISAARIDPGSSAQLAHYNVPLWYDWGNYYGIPYCTVSGDHPKYIFGATYASESDVSTPFPIPALAHSVNGWSEQLDRTIDSISFGGDRHLMCVDVANNALYEIYQVYHNHTSSPVVWDGNNTVPPDGYFSASVAHWDMNTNNTRPPGWTSSDAAGLQVLPGLVQYDEVMSGEPIRHAHRVTFNLTKLNAHVWPATHDTSSGSATSPPLGMRLRLKAGKTFSSTCNSSTPEGKAGMRLMQSLKDYGLIVADNGTTGLVTGTNDARWGDYESAIRVAIGTCLHEVNIKNDMEVVELGWAPPLDITTALLPHAIRGQPYNQIVRGTGGYNNYVWTITLGSLPTGLSMVSTGTWMAITGTSTGTGTSTFKVHLADAHVPPVTIDRTLSITVDAPNVQVPNAPGQPQVAITP